MFLVFPKGDVFHFVPLFHQNLELDSHTDSEQTDEH